MAIPAFSDIAKASNDLLTKDFYHAATVNLDVKTKAPNGVNFNVKGRSTREGSTSGSIEGKYTDAPSGTYFKFHHVISSASSSDLSYRIILGPGNAALLMTYRRAGLTITQAWTTANVLDTKVELEDYGTKGLKIEGITTILPKSQKIGGKVNLYFKQPNFNGRAFFDVLNGPTANVDAVLGHEGFLVGAEAGYDVQKAAITRYSAAIGYIQPEYSAAVTANNNLSVFSASYFHKVNSEVEAGAKATWDSKAGNNVGLEVAAKYRLDPTSFAKAKVNDRGIAALAYNIRLRPGVIFGVGVSLDTQNLNEAAHKVGTTFNFEG